MKTELSLIFFRFGLLCARSRIILTICSQCTLSLPTDNIRKPQGWYRKEALVTNGLRKMPYIRLSDYEYLGKEIKLK